MGLFTRDAFYSLSLYAKLLDEGPDKREQSTSGICTYPAVVLAPNGRDGAQRYTKVVVRSLANHLAHVQRREQRVAIHWKKISKTP